MEDPHEIQAWELLSLRDDHATVADHDQELAAAIDLLKKCEGFALITLKGPYVECHTSVPRPLYPGLVIGIKGLIDQL